MASREVIHPQILYINPANTDRAKGLDAWISEATEIPLDHITTINIANGDEFPIDLSPYDGIIGGGSGSSAYHSDDWIRRYESFFRDIADQPIPQLLICFSHQTKAKSEGATVQKVGKYRYRAETITLTDEGRKDPLFKGLPDEFVVFDVNGDFVTGFNALNKVDRPTELARSKEHRNEALSYRPYVKSVQFHPERTDEIMGHLAEIRRGYQLPQDMIDAYTWYPTQDPSKRIEAGKNGRRIVKNWIRYYVKPYQRERTAK